MRNNKLLLTTKYIIMDRTVLKNDQAYLSLIKKMGATTGSKVTKSILDIKF